MFRVLQDLSINSPIPVHLYFFFLNRTRTQVWERPLLIDLETGYAISLQSVFEWSKIIRFQTVVR